MKTKHQDLQPMLDYFGMLQTYERKGYLEVLPEKGEAYITQPALFTFACVSFEEPKLADVNIPHVMKNVGHTACRIRTYAGWKSQQGKSYIDKPFALHVVADQHPHDLLYTLLLMRRRVWWKLWRKTDRIEVIDYKTQAKP